MVLGYNYGQKDMELMKKNQSRSHLASNHR